MNTESQDTYRAAIWGDGQADTVLTRPEHAGMSDEDLLQEALAEALRAGLVDLEESDPEAAYPLLTRAQFDAGLYIGTWRESV